MGDGEIMIIYPSVQSRLCDTTPVDPRLFMDDSGYRGTVGGCVDM